MRKVPRASEELLPVTVTYDHRRSAVENLLVNCERAAAKRLYAKGSEKVARNSGDIHAHGFTAARNGLWPIVVQGEPGKRVILRAKILEVRIGQTHSVTVGSLFPYAHDLLWIWIRKRTQQHCVYNREDGS